MIDHGDINAIKSALKNNVDVNVKFGDGESALELSIAAGRIEIAKLLIAKGAIVSENCLQIAKDLGISEQIDPINIIKELEQKSLSGDKEAHELLTNFHPITPHAQAYLASLYLQGHGVEKNTDKAFDLYNEAAQQGDLNAQTILSCMYQEGMGVEASEVMAEEWLQKAGEHHDFSCNDLLGVIVNETG